MMKKTKAEIFKQLFYHWCGVLDITNNGVIIEAIKDNRMDTTCCIYNYTTFPIVKYHSRKLGQKHLHTILHLIFHEIGHLKNKMPYETKKEKILSERVAEKYALKMVKKHYPNEYKLYVFYIKKFDILNKKLIPLYYEAFKTIKEYK